MKFALNCERVYPHLPEKVWQALVDPKALGAWLMETDFMPEVGREFRMWCDDGAGGTDTYLCKLLAFEPPKRMLWSWILEDRASKEATLVELRVEAVSGGAKVTVIHSGDRDAETIERFRGGWPWKLQQLEDVLASGANAR